MAEIIAVVSGKGGTGKTSVCAGVGTALAEAGRRVLCIDCDVGLRNLDISLGMTEQSTLSFLDISEFGYAIADAAVCTHFPKLTFLTAPMNRRAEDIDSEAFRNMLRSLREDFDYILLDAPAGLDAGFRLAAEAADQFLLVTGPGPAAVRDAARVGELLELQGKSRVRLVVNRVDREMLATIRLTIDDVMDEAGLPLAGLVMEDPHITLAAAFGHPLLKYYRRCDAAKAFRRIASRIQGIHTPISLR